MADQTTNTKKEPDKTDASKSSDTKKENTVDSKPKTLDEAASALESALKKQNASSAPTVKNTATVKTDVAGSDDKTSGKTDSDAAAAEPKHRLSGGPKHFLLGFAAALFIIVTFFCALWFVRLPSISDTLAIDTVSLPENVSYLASTGTMDLSQLAPKDAVDVARNYQAHMQESAVIEIGDDKTWTAEMVDELQDAFPNTEVTGTITATDWTAPFLDEFAGRNKTMNIVGTVKIGGVSAPLEAVELNMTGMNITAIADLEEALPLFENLEKIDFGTDEEGYKDLEEISGFASAHPELGVKYHFTVWGKKVSLHAKKLDLNHIKMDDQGKQVRDVLPYMPDVTFLDMDFCDVDNEHMAAIRDDFPDIKVVWRIWFGARYSVRTDVEKILASAPLNGGLLNPENTVALKYCTDLKYLDIGHNDTLQDISFISYMPKLEVLIIMWGHITDISPIADCPKMEFLEIFTNNITDLTPLKDLKEIKHLNICNNPNMDDITPLYDLHTLERLWIGRANRIPPEQVEKFMELNPDCDVKFVPCDPHDGWRWGVPRYEILRETFGYGRADYQTINNDPLYYPHPDDDEEEEDDDY